MPSNVVHDGNPISSAVRGTEYADVGRERDTKAAAQATGDSLKHVKCGLTIHPEVCMKTYRMLVINPGSTSTKISLFENDRNMFTESVFHDAPVLLRYRTVSEQLPMRKRVVLDFLQSHNVDIRSVDVFIGRGGCAYSQHEGVMTIDEKLYRDTDADKGGSDHPAKLGVMLAYEFGTEYGKPMYTVDPTNVDELQDVARITGIAGLYRRAQSHVLNQKGIARLHAKSIGRSYEDCNFIVCHIDGGITVSAHRNGRMIDGTEGAGGEGAFTPTRLGSVPALELARYIQRHGVEKIQEMCCRSGGFVSHFGTSDANRIHRMVDAGNEKAVLVWNAMIYQLCKSVGEMAAVLCGDVDAILLTGGLVRFTDIVDGVRKRCGFIAPISVYPGEVEQEVMARSVLSVLRGDAQAFAYTGRPVFSGFPFDVSPRDSHVTTE